MVADKPHVAVAVAGRSEAVAAKTRRERIEQEAAAIGGRREHGIEADPEWIEQEPIPLLLARPTLGDLSCYLDGLGQAVGQGVDINTDRQRVVSGKSGAVSVDLGGGRKI